MREIGLSLRTGLLVWSRNARDLVPWRRLAALHADVLVIPERFRRWGVAKGAHERGYPVYVYTVNETAALERWTRTPGVEGVITDYPDRLAAVLAEAGR